MGRKEIKFLFILLFIIGLGMVLIDYGKKSNTCPEQPIVYKYIPRSQEEEINNPIDVEDIFKTMFTETSPWIGTSRSNPIKKAN